jgi:lysophospholipase L1-like esterase
MHSYTRRLLAVLALPLLSCTGGGTTDPTDTPPPQNTDVHTVVVTVFEDENRNGRIDGDETLWVPDVEVEIGGKVAKSEKRSGRTTVTGVPRGSHTVSIRASSLPPYYVAGTMPTVESPQAGDANVKVPVQLPIGNSMRAGVYFLSGDSISQGESSTSGRGIRPILQDRLLDHFGRGQVDYRGGGGGRTADGALRLDRDLDSIRPAYTIMNWGVNDWHEPGCSNPANTDCLLRSNLLSMVRQVRSYGSLPVLSTIIPCNVGVNDMCTAERNTWVRAVNEVIRALARTERVLMIDTGDAFFKAPNLGALYVDHVHPNDAGYAIMADTYFAALTHGTVASASLGSASFGWTEPGAPDHSAKALR